MRFIRQHWTWFLVLFGTIGYGITVAIFHPGYMSTDSLNQLEQVIGTRAIDDWHPPVMVAVWKVLVWLTHDIASMLMFQLLLLWSALTIMAVLISRSRAPRWLSILPIVVGLMPFTLAISGVIWKDCQMAFALLLATVGIVWITYSSKESRLARYSVAGAVLLLMVYALLLRYNAFVAIVPLIYVLCRVMKLSWLRSIAVFVGFVVLSVLLSTLITASMNAKKTHPVSAVMIDDIANILTVGELRSQPVSDFLKDNLIEARQQCQKRDPMLNVSGWCMTSDLRLNITSNYYDELSNLWLRTILTHKGEYIAFKTWMTSWFLSSPQSAAYYWQRGINKNELSLEVPDKFYGHATETYVKNFGYEHFSFLYKPWFWLIANVVLLTVALKKFKRRTFTTLVVALNLSSLLYIISYIPVVIGSDYRYIYWPVLATVMSFIIFLWKGQKQRKTRQ